MVQDEVSKDVGALDRLAVSNVVLEDLRVPFLHEFCRLQVGPEFEFPSWMELGTACSRLPILVRQSKEAVAALSHVRILSRYLWMTVWRVVLVKPYLMHDARYHVRVVSERHEGRFVGREIKHHMVLLVEDDVSVEHLAQDVEVAPGDDSDYAQ